MSICSTCNMKPAPITESRLLWFYVAKRFLYVKKLDISFFVITFVSRKLLEC